MRRSSLALAVLALAVAVSAPGCAASGGRAPAVSDHASAGGPSNPRAADRFLADYVTDDGRVIRHDQGGDIVSEGQAYGMLLAEVAGRPALARTIWAWTSRHLGRSDGLFAWHATGAGRIESPQSATDADILIAYALVRYRGQNEAAMRRAGRRVAGAVLTNEAIVLRDGTLLPVAGPWATSTGPPTANPSYLMPGVFHALARLTGDRRWAQTARAAVALMRRLTGDGRRLPPDWAVVSQGELAPRPQPGGGAGVRYGPDAARVPLWFATACDSGARRLASTWWNALLRRERRYAAGALTLSGAPIQTAGSPLNLLAGAATAMAAGDVDAARTLRARAETLAANMPSYYGDAWAAMGPALLDRRLVPC